MQLIPCPSLIEFQCGLQLSVDMHSNLDSNPPTALMGILADGGGE
jgi:hypothetical protein